MLDTELSSVMAVQHPIPATRLEEKVHLGKICFEIPLWYPVCLLRLSHSKAGIQNSPGKDRPNRAFRQWNGGTQTEGRRLADASVSPTSAAPWINFSVP